MDQLEHYLDQVCRGLGGSRSLRQHVRQELREHLLDAAAEHRATGMSEAEALARALADFGGPDQVHSELAATHGHRLLSVIIDKAMQWKEMTVKAKWLWTTWANLALAGVVVMEVMFITFMTVFIIPKFQRLTLDGVIDAAMVQEQGVSWMPGFLSGLRYVGGHYTTLLLLGALAAIGLFEWRVKSENKPMMRLSALGTAAVGLMVVVSLTAASLVISVTVGAPAMARLARPYALDQVAKIDASVGALDQALAKKDWEAMQEQADRAGRALGDLAKASPAFPALAGRDEPPTVEELRSDVMAASGELREAQQAIRDKDSERTRTALQKFHDAFAPIGKAAARRAN
jgi:hypothetical protein